MRDQCRISPLLGLVTVTAGSVLIGSPVYSQKVYSQKANHPTVAPPRYSDKTDYPAVFTLVTPGVFNVNYAQQVPPAPVTKPGDPIPLPKHALKGKKY